MRRINMLVISLLLGLCACAANDNSENQNDMAPVFLTKGDILPFVAEADRFCERSGSFAFMTREGCRESTLRLAQDLEERGLWFEGKGQCVDYMETLLTQRKDLLLRHFEWCTDNFDNLHDRKGCRDVADVFYNRMNTAEFCWNAPAPGREVAGVTPYIHNYREPGQKFDTPKTGYLPKPTSKTPVNKAENSTNRAAKKPENAASRSITPARNQTPVVKKTDTPLPLAGKPAAQNMPVMGVPSASAVSAPSSPPAPRELSGSIAGQDNAGREFTPAQATPDREHSSGAAAIAPAPVFETPRALDNVPEASPAAANLPASETSGVIAIPPAVPPPPVQAGMPPQPVNVPGMGMNPVGGVPAGVLATGGGQVSATAAQEQSGATAAPAPSPTPSPAVSGQAGIPSATPVIGRVEAVENLPPVPPIGQVVTPLMPGVPPDTAVSAATLPAGPSSAPAQTVPEPLDPADAFGGIIPNFLPPPPPPQPDGGMPVVGLPSAQVGN